MKIGAIIVTFNAMNNNWIDKCLKSLRLTDVDEVIVIDNNSDDYTVDFIKKNFSDIKLVESKINLGFGKANNLGLKLALELGCDYFYLVNQDVVSDKNVPIELAKCLENNIDYGIVSPIHLNGKGTDLDFGFKLQVTSETCPAFFSDLLLNRMKEGIYESGFICAASWMISKKCLKIVGGFNPVFYHYGEDTEYIHRLKNKNFKIGFLPNHFIYHDRENRDITDNLYKNTLKFNLELLKYSIIDSRFDIEMDINKMKKWYSVKKIKFQNSEAMKLKEKIFFLESNKQMILKSKLILKSNVEYAFINNERI